MKKMITPKDVAIFLETATQEELLETGVLYWKFHKSDDLSYDRENDLRNFNPGIFSLITSEIDDYLQNEQGYEYANDGYVKRAV